MRFRVRCKILKCYTPAQSYPLVKKALYNITSALLMKYHFRKYKNILQYENSIPNYCAYSYSSEVTKLLGLAYIICFVYADAKMVSSVRFHLDGHHPQPERTKTFRATSQTCFHVLYNNPSKKYYKKTASIW